MKRFHQGVLIGSTVLASWLGMQAVHECGHVLGAYVTGGEVRRVVLNPLSISRTELGRNPNPLVVVWAGPVFGVLSPMLLWGMAHAAKLSGVFVLRFFAGSCLIANGAYIAIGSLDRIGDAGELFRRGSPIWQLWLFGAVTMPVGFWLWHQQGRGFGLGAANGEVNTRVACATLVVAALLVVIGFLFGG